MSSPYPDKLPASDFALDTDLHRDHCEETIERWLRVAIGSLQMDPAEAAIGLGQACRIPSFRRSRSMLPYCLSHDEYDAYLGRKERFIESLSHDYDEGSAIWYAERDKGFETILRDIVRRRPSVMDACSGQCLNAGVDSLCDHHLETIVRSIDNATLQPQGV